MQLPTRNPVTMSYGSTAPPYSSSSPHKGTDFGWGGLDGKNIFAVEDCTLTYKANNGNDGNGLYAQVGDHTWGYLHLDHPVKTGAVKQGDLIGVMGNTGEAEGIHLHLALKVNGAYTDPYKYIKERENTMSTIGETEFHDLFVGFFGPITDENPVWDSDRKSWIGTESNTVIRQMYADPRQQKYATTSKTGKFKKVEVYVPED